MCGESSMSTITRVSSAFSNVFFGLTSFRKENAQEFQRNSKIKIRELSEVPEVPEVLFANDPFVIDLLSMSSFTEFFLR